MLALFAAALCAHMVSPPTAIYVSPSGQDESDGTQPSASRRHGPVKSIRRALEIARRSSHLAEIILRGGEYDLTAPIKLGAADSDTFIHPYRNEHPVVTGSIGLTGWRRVAGGWWEAEVPPNLKCEQLFVNDQRRLRPRLPADGYFKIAGEIQGQPPSKGEDSFRVRPQDVDRAWPDLNSIEVIAFHNWHVTRDLIDSVNGDVLKLRNPTGFADGWASFPAGHRYILENVRAAFGRAGEWYFDPSRRVVQYTPFPGENMARLNVRVPVCEDLLEIEGAHGVQVRGIAFCQTAWSLGPQGRNFPQAEADLPGAIRLTNATHSGIENCTVRQTGAYAIEIGQGCQDVAIGHCQLSDLGGGGVKIGEMARTEEPARLTERIKVADCLIEGCGRIHPAAVGIWIGQSPNNIVSHNTIKDLYYTGISVGWSWGYGPSGSNHNLIEDNRIEDVGQGVLSDMGGIYTLGLAPGTTLRGNVISDVRCDPAGYGGWGIYPDEGSSDLTIENNLVYRTSMAGFHQHYGAHNLVRNNIFAYGGQFQLMRTRAEDHQSFTLEHNIVYWDSGPLLGSNWTGSNYRLDYNDYWRTDRKEIDFMGSDIAKWRQNGQDVHSLIADPRFVDPKKGDFHLKAGSPAVAIGFVPWRYEDAGITWQPGKTTVSAGFPRN